MSDLIHIDGSFGEGGGQILRSSLALSMITGKPFRIDRIRANRDKPGLRRQHLTAVRAAAQISAAKVTGDELGSRSLTFRPGKVTPGNYTFSIGTAGSTTMVFQAILPALILADAPSELMLEGGTHNPGAPPFDFLQRVFVPLVGRMGPRIEMSLDRPGFAPAGQGRWTARIEPARQLAPLHLPQRGEIRGRWCTVLLAGLPDHIAQRELQVLQRGLGWEEHAMHTRRLPAEQGPGNAVLVEIASEHITELFTGFGQLGIRAETVAHNVLSEVQRYLDADVPVGEHLADQLLLPMALAGEGSMLTLPLTSHSWTNIQVIRKFLDVPISADEVAPGRWRITVG